jgi:hypothetical protein
MTKPILFSTPMVQAIIRGDKTQTRRIIKWSEKIDGDTSKFTIIKKIEQNDKYSESVLEYPYKKGDTLWVRETFDPTGCMGSILYKADYSASDLNDAAKGVFKWKPSIFMPKSAARIFLSIVDVSIEFLNSITPDDAIAEGIMPWGDCKKHYVDYCKSAKSETPLTPIASFKSLWESIHGKNSWDKNPVVFVYTFERIDKPINF